VGQQVDPQGAQLPLTLRHDWYLRVIEAMRNRAVAQRLNYLAASRDRRRKARSPV